jgi:NAD(P)-dependent dehydrogenase (short-subunit alcohol dehydrogenase family)
MTAWTGTFSVDEQTVDPKESVMTTSDSLSPYTTALVTGATSGIGRSTAQALASLGLHVVLSGRDEIRGRKAVEEITGAGGRADFIAADLRDAGSALALARRAEQLLGHVDVLVNNAGVAAGGPTADTTEAAFDELVALNVKVPYFLTGALAPAMAGRGRGAIVNVSAMVASFGMAGTALFGSTKAAINLLTKAWADEFGPAGVRVNAVSPGPISSEGTAAARDGQQHLASLAPARRIGRPDEVAAAITFLVSSAGAFVQGVILPVDGGRTAV